MTVSTVYAVISTANVDAARDWYERLFGRAADREPMAGVLEWYFGSGGVQLVADAQRAGCSLLTMIVSSLERTRADLRIRRLTLGPATAGDMAAIARIRDPEGNLITFAEPGAV
jgi:catechol 2,3-dioxygenase-like lactoylglutathione lyase family enzyme